jgi:HEAT repeats
MPWTLRYNAQYWDRYELSLTVWFATTLLAMSASASVERSLSSSEQSRADELVMQLRELPTALPGVAPSNGITPPIELRRQALYSELRQLGSDALPALARGLSNPDVQIRRNVALVLNVLAGSLFDRSQLRVNIRESLSALVAALGDSDSTVRAWAAQAIGAIGPDAAEAVPALVILLRNGDEGSRNSACIALRKIGPDAKGALPALQEALSDQSAAVRRFAMLAIDSIQHR